jgi:hypothetical protein
MDKALARAFDLHTRVSGTVSRRRTKSHAGHDLAAVLDSDDVGRSLPQPCLEPQRQVTPFPGLLKGLVEQGDASL